MASASEPTAAPAATASMEPSPLHWFLESMLKVGAAEAPSHVVPQVADKRGQRKKEDVRQTVLIHLFEPSLDVLSAVIRHSPGTDSAPVAISLVLLLQQSQRTEEFLRRELTARLHTARQAGTSAVTNLLRDNSLVVMMLMAFAQLEGLEFMRAAFAGPLAEVLQLDAALEVNPAKGVSEPAVEANIARLEHACGSIMDAVRAHKELITPSFRRLCSFVRKSVEEALESPEALAADAPDAVPESESPPAGAPLEPAPLRMSPSGNLVSASPALTPALKVLSSFFFLRYAVPAVTNPVKYCVLPPTQVIPPEKQTSLIYIAKVLTSLCNGVYYGQKELYMMPMNPFLRSQEDNMKTFLEFVSEVPLTAPVPRRLAFDQRILEAALDHIFAFLSSVLPRTRTDHLSPTVQAHLDVLLSVINSDKALTPRRFGTISMARAVRLVRPSVGSLSSARVSDDAGTGSAAVDTAAIQRRHSTPLATAWFVHALGGDEDGSSAAVAASIVAGVELPAPVVREVAAAVALVARQLAASAALPAHARAAEASQASVPKDEAWLATADVSKLLPPLPPGVSRTAASDTRLRKLLRSAASLATGTTSGASLARTAPEEAVAGAPAPEATVADVANAVAALPPGLRVTLDGTDLTRLWTSAADLSAEFAAAAVGVDTPAVLGLEAAAKLQLALSLILERLLNKVGQTCLADGRTRAAVGDVHTALAGLDGWAAFAAAAPPVPDHLSSPAAGGPSNGAAVAVDGAAGVAGL